MRAFEPGVIIVELLDVDVDVDLNLSASSEDQHCVPGRGTRRVSGPITTMYSRTSRPLTLTSPTRTASQGTSSMRPVSSSMKWW